MNATNRSEEFFLEKARKYCSVQDRCRWEVLNKLREWKCPTDLQNPIIDQLLVDGFIDEQRFTRNYVRGKFRINDWGRIKIMSSLMVMGIENKLIDESFDEINEQEYREKLLSLLKKKWKITAGSGIAKMNKTAAYAINKGYESTLVYELLNQTNEFNHGDQ